MGEMADMHLDGTLCEQCGVFLNGDSPGYRRLCSGCASNEECEREVKSKKVRCPTCQKRVSRTGLEQHRKDKHGNL